jgi:hypothetical protein
MLQVPQGGQALRALEVDRLSRADGVKGKGVAAPQECQGGGGGVTEEPLGGIGPDGGIAMEVIVNGL